MAIQSGFYGPHGQLSSIASIADVGFREVMGEHRELAARLRGDEALRREGVTCVVDVWMQTRLADLIDVGGLVDVATAAMNSQLMERVVLEHIEPAWERHKEHCATAGESVSHNLPPEVREQLAALVADMDLPTFQWAGSAVDPLLLRELFAPALTEWLLSFVRKLPLVGSGLTGGLAGGFAGAMKSARARTKRSVLGNMDERVQSTADGFSRSAMSELRAAISKRMASDDGQAIIRDIRLQLFTAIMEADLATIMEDLDRVPRKDMMKLGPAIFSHNASRKFGVAVVRREIEAALALEGEHTLADLAEQAGVLPQIRAYLRVNAERLLDSLLEDQPFLSWLQKLQSASE